ncbi:unnamed protein product [Moneuplotes crassus]|uniref:P-type ATPase A domain-containing protein n=1 Tax=Euplotes crassus TaxID=5936 RepID=A0AAD1UH64_EUPCR|nr:unnamed protein product [Moneuplotes crassus]
MERTKNSEERGSTFSPEERKSDTMLEEKDPAETPLLGYTLSANSERDSSKSDLLSISPNNIDYGLSENCQITTLEYNKMKMWAFYIIFGILTVGIMPILSIWIVDLKVFMMYTKINGNVEEATHLKIYEKSKGSGIVELKKSTKRSTLPHSDGRILDRVGDEEYIKEIKFRYRYLTYNYCYESEKFETVAYDFHYNYNKIHSRSCGLTKDQLWESQDKYGDCTMNIIIRPWYRIVFEDILNFYYGIQVFSVVIWCMNGYYRSGVVIGAMTFASIVAELYDEIRSLKRLKEMAHYETSIYVKRIGSDGVSISTEINSNEIVPGDIILVPEGKQIPCDAILLEGECVVNEAMLTGESLPAIKTALPKSDEHTVDDFSIENTKQKMYFLFAGTEIVQSRMMNYQTPPYALVTRTNFLTTKGALIRSILYSAVKRFDFQSEACYVLFVSFFLTAAIMGTVLPKFIDNFSTYDVVIRTMNALTVAIPAMLPVCMSIGILFSYTRLYLNEIYCSQPRKIEAAGRVKTMIFDKTGTLTHEGLTATGIKVSNQKDFNPTIRNISQEIATFQSNLNIDKYDSEEIFTKFIECMACCHCCTYINEKLVGDPLEVEMFEKSNWVMDESEEQNNHKGGRYLATFYPRNESNVITDDPELNREILKLNILLKNEFQSELQSMSVIAKNNIDGSLVCFMKGSPEKIFSRCDQSTLPSNYMTEVDKIAEKGLRVISLAYRTIDPLFFNIEHPPNRKELEKNMTFLGFIIFENKLKENTAECIRELNDGEIKCIIATGDNGKTASSVARNCGIVSEDSYFRILLDESDKNAKKLTCELVKENNSSNRNRGFVVLDEEENHLGDTDEEAEENQPFIPNDPQERNANGDPFDLMMDPNSLLSVSINGKAFNHLLKMPREEMINDKYNAQEILDKVVKDCKVFSRMSPKQKAKLVKKMQGNGQIVGMCGDGANDCTALKTADIGLSLSQAEASIAAPFTSKSQDISSVIILLNQGRAALDLSTTLFKFVILTSSIQLSSMIILYYSTSNLDDLQYGYIGLCLVFPILLCICLMKPSDRLVSELPIQSFLHWSIILSIIGQSLISIGVQIGGYFAMRGEDYFTVAPESDDYTTDGYETTAVFLTSTPQYLFIGIVFNLFTKFRMPLYKNYVFMLILLVQVGITYWIIIRPAKFMRDDLELMELDSEFRWFLCLITICNGAACVLMELIIYLLYQYFK